jgi:hypothetical protein
MHREDPVPGPFVDEKSSIKFFGQLVGRGRALIKSVDWACTGGATSVANLRETGGGSVGIPDERGLGWREFRGAGV